MEPRRVVFMDTSVLMRLIGMDGDGAMGDIAAEFEQRAQAGQQFVIPVTAIVETGNRIAQRPSDRRRFSERLAKILEAVRSGELPWLIHGVVWDDEFVDELLAGDATGSRLVDLVGDGRLGTGDVAVLVERERFRRKTAFVDVEIWSFDQQLAAFS